MSQKTEKKTIQDQIHELNANNDGETIKAATPEEAFARTKVQEKAHNNKLSASISLSLQLETDFKLMSYRVHSQEQYMYNVREAVNRYLKVIKENS